jgi:hypothetical protein
MGKPAWREKPSFFLVADKDRMVAPDTQRFLAARMKSVTTTIQSDHDPLASHAGAIVELVDAASR